MPFVSNERLHIEMCENGNQRKFCMKVKVVTATHYGVPRTRLCRALVAVKSEISSCAGAPRRRAYIIEMLTVIAWSATQCLCYAATCNSWYYKL